MSKIRVHILMGTIRLPNRQLADKEVSHDQLDIPCEPNWELKEIEMHPTTRPLVRGPSKGKQLAPMVSASSLFDDKWLKYRAVFVEKIDAVDEPQHELELPQGESDDAELIE